MSGDFGLNTAPCAGLLPACTPGARWRALREGRGPGLRPALARRTLSQAAPCSLI